MALLQPTNDTMVDEGVGDSDEDSVTSTGPLSRKERLERDRQRRKNQTKKQKKKKAKERRREQREAEDDDEEEIVQHQPSSDYESAEADDEADADEIVYVTEDPELPAGDPSYQHFAQVFQAFKIGAAEDADGAAEMEASTAVEKVEEVPTKAAIVERILQQEMEEKKAQEETEAEKLSKRKLKLMLRPSIAELKASCPRPDVVEWHDATARDPKLLVQLKSLRNSIPVPRHWCFKRKYLAGKRGYERPPFELPAFIKRTGIMEMREALAEKEDEKSLKTKMRERVRPKMGRIDIDYQKLHDAFFRWQTKPRMTIVGDLYYEGKELETQMREKKPGELSDDLRIALGMPVGPNAYRFPPPWLIAMQRYGPPPSYPNLKIAGLNGPIPEGCAFGYHAGGWGKPPVDQHGRPLYGDVFGLEVSAEPNVNDEAEIERNRWGAMEESDEEEQESSDEADEDDQQTTVDDSGLVTPALTEGLITPSGISSGMPTGVETPDSSIELRKKKLMEEGVDTPAGPLYTVVPEKRVDRIGGQMMASTHVYDVDKAKRDKAGAATDGGIEISLNPEELDFQDAKGLEKKYEEQIRKQQKGGDDDFSDMVAEHAAKQKRKRKAVEEKKSTSSSSSAKKYKDFKF